MQLATINQSAAELAVASSAAQAKALVEAKYTIALHRPRDIMQVRDRILSACRRPLFAERVQYRKPVGRGFITGPSIRFAEECVRAMGNVDVTSMVLYEDAEKMVVRITAIDLETNSSYADDVVIGKTIERSNPGDREVIGTRTNSKNQPVYILASTADEMQTKIAAAKSKVIRNNGLRLVPSDIVEEAIMVAAETMETGGEDRDAKAKKTADAFASIGVKPGDLKAFLGVEITAASPRQLSELREIYAAIRDGETTWKAVLETAKPEPAAPATSSMQAGPALTGPAEKPAESKAPAAEAEVAPEAQLFDEQALRHEIVKSTQKICANYKVAPGEMIPDLIKRGIVPPDTKPGGIIGLPIETLNAVKDAAESICADLKDAKEAGKQ